MNSGFMEIAKLDKFDCFIFHDVDLLPEDDRIFYTCDQSGIKHLAYALEEWNYKYVLQSMRFLFFQYFQSRNVNGISAGMRKVYGLKLLGRVTSRMKRINYEKHE